MGEWRENSHRMNLPKDFIRNSSFLKHSRRRLLSSMTYTSEHFSFTSEITSSRIFLCFCFALFSFFGRPTTIFPSPPSNTHSRIVEISRSNFIFFHCYFFFSSLAWALLACLPAQLLLSCFVVFVLFSAFFFVYRFVLDFSKVILTRETARRIIQASRFSVLSFWLWIT